MLTTIEKALASLRKSERKVGEFVLTRPEDIIHMRIVDLARQADVSEPTVVRFCRAIGCDSFQGFKLALAQHLAQIPKYEQFSLSEHDSAEQYAAKVFDSIFDSLQRVRESLDSTAIESAVEVLADAKRVAFFGFGASSAVAMDAQHKFFRLQIASAAYADPHIQAMAAMSLAADDVVVAISQSGRTRALLDAMQLVKDTGACVIGVAPSHTPVAQLCDIPIFVDVEEDTEIYSPLPSRMAHMAVIDVLAVGVAKVKGPEVGAHLRKLDRGLQSLRTD